MAPENGNGKLQGFVVELLKMALAVAIGTSSAMAFMYATFETKDSHDRDVRAIQREMDLRHGGN